MKSKVLTEERADLYIIRINRAACRNAIDKETAHQLYEAIEKYENDDSLKVAILSGVGDHFCAGADLKAISDQSGLAPELKEGGLAPLGISRITPTKPVIAAVEGYAVAGGLELALWCDIRVVSESAIFGVFCRRFGVPLVDGGTIRLPRIIGQGRAMEMILTGRPVAASEALSWGLANQMVPIGESLSAAKTLAKSISKHPQFCMRSDRMSTIEQWDMDLMTALSNETRRGIEVIQSGETLAGARRFSS